jgi:hypothetical protein
MKLLNSMGGGMKLGTGLALGAAAVLLAPVILPVAAGVLRTLTKASIKGGLLMYEKGKIAMAEAKETMDDLAAEAKAELASEEAAPKRKTKKTAAAGA